MSSSPQPVVDLLVALERALAGLGVRWFLFGAQAAILHGAARLSADVDVTVDLGNRPLTTLLEALERAGFEPTLPDPVGFAERTRVLPLVHRATRMPVDVVLAGPGLEEQFLAGAESRDVGGIVIPVARAEDLIVMKILAGRPRDLDDVDAIVGARGDTLDLDRTRATLRKLEQALDRRDLVSELERLVAAAARKRRGPATS